MRHRLVLLALLVVAAAAFAAPQRALAANPPTITSFTPTTGSTNGGTVLNVYGTGFVSGAYVSVGGVLSGSVNVLSSTHLTAVTPARAAGTVQVVVINPDGQSAYTSGFVYSATTTNQNSGTVWFSPSTGPVGQLVHITGSGFTDNMTVLFGGVPATETVRVSGSYLMTYAPPGVSGSVLIQVVNSAGVSSISDTTFTYTGTTGTSTGSLSITAVSPTSVSPGATLSIYGTGFISGATVNVGGYIATNVSVASSTLITATAPTGPTGTVTVLVTNPGGAVATRPGLSYGGTTSGTGTQPSVTSVSPSTGSSAGGTVVSIHGSGFVSPASVTFGGVPATSVTVVNSNLISATAPANPVGVVSVLVSNGGGAVGGLTSGFTYELAWPRVTSISPSTGALGGGTTLTITGTGFAPGATVTIGGQAASTVSAVSPTQIVVTTPPGPSGAATVLVTNPGGAISGLASGFAYSANPQTPPPPPPSTTALTITGVAPSTGPSTGGTAISIYGTGFVTGATVSIGGISVNGTVVSSTLIAASTPAVSGTGSVTVSVANPGASAVFLPNAFTYVAGGTSSGGTGGTSSPVPEGGGLFVFAGGTNAQLLAASGCNASTAVFWTTDDEGTWIGYIPSVTVSIVNAAWTALFPNGIPAGTPIYARC